MSFALKLYSQYITNYDVARATLSEAEDVRRTQQLEVIRRIEEQVEQTKKELAAAELNLQIGR